MTAVSDSHGTRAGGGPGTGASGSLVTGQTTRLTWAPSAHHRRLVTVALLPLFAAMVFGQARYLVLAAPVLAALALADHRPRREVWVSLDRSADRVVEGEDVAIRIRVEPGGPVDQVRVTLRLPPELEVTETTVMPPGHRSGAQELCQATETNYRVTTQRWGRWTSDSLVRVRSRGGLFDGSAAIDLSSLTVLPRPPVLTRLVLPAELHARIGDHVDRRRGDGAEFAGVRPFTPGDRLRRINWPVTSRRGALHVNQFAAERSAEIVALVDAFTDAGPPGESALDRAVRGAAALARAYSRAGDRVGIVTLYGPLRWVAPGSGHRQFFRIAESVLDARDALSFLPADVSRVPRAVLPLGALLVFFTPLLDDRAIAAAIDLRERGYPLIVVDVLSVGPRPRPGVLGDLPLRLWRLEREALRYHLESAGIPVTSWPGETGHPEAVEEQQDDLNMALGRFARHRVRGVTR